MKTGKMKCGACGHDLFTLEKEDQAIHTICQKCKSRSILIIQPAEIKITWGVDAKGRITIF